MANNREAMDTNPNGLAVLTEGNGDRTSPDVVAIHGLSGGRKSSWLSNDNDPKTCWLETIFPQSRVMLYGYNTGRGAEDFYTRSGIIKEARNLLNALDELRKDDQKNKPLYFVGHGVGGLLIKAALSLATRTPTRYVEISSAVRVLIFFGYPHSSPSTNELRQQMFQHAVASPLAEHFPSNLLQLTDNLTQMVTEVNHLFLHDKVVNQAHMINVISQSTNSGFPQSANVMRVPFERILKTKKTHLEMSRLDQDMMDSLKNIFNEDWVRSITKEQATVLRTLWLQSSPSFGHHNDGVSTNSTSLNDAVASAIKDLLSTEEDRVLHLEYDHEGIDMTSQIFSFLHSQKRGDEIIHAYQIDPNDIRFNNMDVVLRSILSNLGYHATKSNSNALNDMVSDISSFHVWVFEDLLKYWAEYIYYDQEGHHIYLFTGMDQCSDSMWSAKELISYLASLISNREGRFRMIITTTANGKTDLSEATSRFPDWVYHKVEIERKVILRRSRTAYVRDLNLYLAQLLHKSPRFSEGVMHEKVQRVFEKCEDDEDLRHVIRQWLQTDQRPLADLSEELDQLFPANPEAVFDTILARTPEEHQTCALNLLCWILCSVRPLRSTEFCLVANLSGKVDQTEHLQHVLDWFGGILRVRNDEIHFGHRGLRPWLESCVINTQSKGWWHRYSDSRKHLEVLSVCLKYFANDPWPQSSPWAGDYSFPYAIKHWVFHFRQALLDEAEFQSAKQMVNEFLADDISRVRWVEAYRSLACSFDHDSLQLDTPLLLAAYFGLENQLEDLKSEEIEVTIPALINATSQGHESSVTRIQSWLPPLPLDSPFLEPLIQAALSCGNSTILKMTIDHIKTSQSGTRPYLGQLPGALVMACWRCSEELVQLLLGIGADSKDTSHDGSERLQTDQLGENYSSTGVNVSAAPRPRAVVLGSTKAPTRKNVLLASLKAAIRKNAVKIINKLLDHRPEVLNDPSIVGTLGDCGTDEAIRLLFKRGFSSDAKAPNGKTALEWACFSGRHTTVETLLNLDPYEKHKGSSVRTALLLAAQYGRTRTIKTLLKHNVNPNEVGLDATSIEYAVSSGKVPLCRSLLEAGADPNTTPKGGHPPLLRAVQLTKPSMVEMVKLLLEFNTDTEARDPCESKHTPLLVAAALEHERGTEAVQLLLENGADADAVDSKGHTALYLAAGLAPPRTVELLADRVSNLYATCTPSLINALHAACARPEAARILIKRGMDPDNAYKAGFCALELVACKGTAETMEVMVEGQQHDPGSLGLALIEAIRAQNEKCVQILLDAGASVDATTVGGDPALFVAMAYESDSIFLMVLEYGGNLKTRGRDGGTVLHLITASTPLNSLRRAINGGAPLNAVDRDGHTPLHLAITRENWAAVRYLLTKQVVRGEINHVGNHGTALHLACGFATLEIVKLLVEHGADPDLMLSSDRGTPLMWACIRDDNDSEEVHAITHYLLHDKGASMTYSGSWYNLSPWDATLMNGPVRIVRLFLEQGAGLEGGGAAIRYPVHLACYNSLAVIKELSLPDDLFDVNDIFGRSPLHYAAAKSQLDLLEYVLQRLVEIQTARLDRSVSLVDVVNSRDEDGWTALHWAGRRFCSPGSPMYKSTHEVIEFLLDRGADPCAEGRVALTDSDAEDSIWRPSDVAAYHANSKLANRLRRAEISGARPEYRRPKMYRVGQRHPRSAQCVACDSTLFGSYYSCETGDDFALCFKCIRRAKDLHDPDHKLQRGGIETEERFEDIKEDAASEEDSSSSDVDEAEMDVSDESDKGKASRLRGARD